MKRSKLKKKSRTPLAKAKEKLWKTLKELISKRDGNVCISCGQGGLEGYHKQGGHFIPSASCGGFLRYDLRNVFIQCSVCNLYRNGAGAEYTRALEKKFSPAFVDKVIADKQISIKLDVDYVDGMRAYYETLLDMTPKQLTKLTANYNGYKPT